MNSQPITKERLIAFCTNLKKPMRVGRIARHFRLKDEKKEQLFFLLEELRKEEVISGDEKIIIPKDYVEVTQKVILTEELVLNYLLTRKKMVNPKDIIKALGANQEDNYENLNKMLLELELNGKVLSKNGNYLLFPQNSNLHVGQIRMPKIGKGYVDDVIIDESNLNGVLPNDIVLVETTNYGDRKYGIVRKILKRSGHSPFTYENGALIPYGFSFKYKINIEPELFEGIEDGDRVSLNLSSLLNNSTYDIDSIKVIAKRKDPSIEYKTIASKYGFDIDFTKEEQEELALIPKHITNKDLENRVDYRPLETITIDGRSAKDMDDAISCEILESGNYKVYVHIADVPHYIKKNSLLHQRAIRNGFTSYLKGATFPMLPPEIANNICSLNEKVDRLTRTFICEISPEGKIIDFQTHLSVINSDMKMTYEDVNEILEEGHMVSGYESHLALLKRLENLSKLLDKQSLERGSLDFASNEIEFSIDENGNPMEFSKREEGTSQRIIKNLMLAAGESTAIYIKWLDLPIIQRVHESPEEGKIKGTINFINSLGYKTRHIRNISNPKSLQYIIKQLSNKEIFPILSDLLLRSMQRARYSIDNFGHYGLALDAYTQVTSPIRRVIDLETHYLLREYENNFDFSMEKLIETEKYLQSVAKQATSREQSADNAEREALKMEMASSMEKRVGEHINGHVVNISKEGVFVKTIDNIVGRVSFNQVCSGKYKFDTQKRCLFCKNNGPVIQIGTPVRIRVLSASKENRTIDFSITDNLKDRVKQERGRSFVKSAFAETNR